MDADRLAGGALLATPGLLVIYFGLSGGGFFPAQPAVGAVFLALVLVVRVACAPSPFAGLSWRVGLAAGAMSLYAIWTLLSATWSHAPARALVEFDRALMYALVILLFGCIGRSRRRLGWMLRGVLAAIVVVCGLALVSRILPHVLPTKPNAVANSRLSYPITYWNTLGLLAALGSLLALHAASSRRDAAIVKALMAALVPALAVTLYFTFSRGAIAAFAVGVLVYMVFARSWTSMRALVAVAVPTAVAVLVAYHAEALATSRPTGPAAVREGHRVGLTLLTCGLAAALLRFALSHGARRWGERMPVPGRPIRLAIPAVICAALVAAALASHVPSRLSRGYDRFISGDQPTVHGDARQRLGDVSNNGRTSQWKASLSAFRGSPFHGQGAGTYQLSWEQHRPRDVYIKDSHSLYFEVLGELGIVGIVLLAAALLTLISGAFSLRRHHRPLSAIVFALLLTWALRAGVDWDWEMPVVTLPVMALGGAALARRQRDAGAVRATPARARILIGLCFLAATAVPALVAVSNGRLERARRAFQHGDCGSARRSAFGSLSVIGDQARPYEIIGYCDLTEGFPRAAVAAFQHAGAKDPENWQYRFDLAAARASAGANPRPSLDAARAMNPHEALIQQVTYAGPPSKWPAEADSAVGLMIDAGLIGLY